MENDEKRAIAGILFLLILGILVRAAPEGLQDRIRFGEAEGRPLTDSVAVPTTEQQPATSSDPVGKVGKPAHVKAKGKLGLGERIDLDTASMATLLRLPGVGPALAERMDVYRKANGPFRTPEDLGKVKGIGKAKLSKMLPLLVFD